MEYSKIITLSKMGFHINHNLMIPIGIKPGYRFWGRFENQEEENYNLIISSLPHASWKALFRIRIRVRTETKVEDVISHVFNCCVNGINDSKKIKNIGIRENQVNILSLNSSISINHSIISTNVEVSRD